MEKPLKEGKPAGLPFGPDLRAYLLLVAAFNPPPPPFTRPSLPLFRIFGGAVRGRYNRRPLPLELR